MAMSRGIFIVAAKRTPFGAFGGKLKDLSQTDLCEVAARAALTAGNINPEVIDSTFIGNVAQTAPDAAYVARHVALRSGIKDDKPALTVNRLCGSGFQSIVSGAQDILTGDAEVVLTGGTENMSMAPYTVRGTRFGTKLGVDLKLEDTLWATLTDYHIKTPMGMTAEKLGGQYGVTRQDCDQFAMLSQQRWQRGTYLSSWRDRSPLTIIGFHQAFVTLQLPYMNTQYMRVC
ncbi:3-ketoacyl-CoA thiolase, mitochondrial-like, partial [Acanthaster planci]|uniref:3-ketoacyl-CoA thiolase, mitochondrial-like n=1 Tax=Acanthaster planci TaxID=133434 RepID=A0A8B8A1E6_ACAPL